MDKLFRKRTEKGSSRSVPRKNEAGKLRPAKPGALPPSLDIDIRNSLIMPSMTERFSMLLPGLSAAPDGAIRDLLAQQRTRVDGPSLTLAEEEMLLAQLRGNAPSPQSFSQMTNISEWDGNPPPFDSDWASGPQRGSLTGSVSVPSQMTASGSDGHLSAQSPRSPGDRSLLSPVPSIGGSSVMDRGRVLPGGSRSFSSNQSFRDNNYLAKVAKDKEDHSPLSPSLSARRVISNSRTSPSVARSPSSATSVARSDLRGTTSPGSERSLTPTATVGSGTPVASTPSANALSPAPSSTTLNRQLSNQSYQSYSPLERATSNRSGGMSVGRRPSNQSIPYEPLSQQLSRQQSNRSGTGLQLDREPSHRSHASPLERKTSNHSQQPLERQASNRSQQQLERQASHRSTRDAPSSSAEAPEVRTVPSRDEPSRLRTKPVGGAPQQRQSLLMGLSPAQAKRISMALLEIESHLGRKGNDDTPSDGPSSGSYVLLNEDQEEVLQGNEDGDESDDGDYEDDADHNATTPGSSTASTPSVPLFPYPLSPPPVPGASAGPPSSTGATTPANKPTSLPASPRTHDLQAMQASQNTPPMASPAQSQTNMSSDSPARSLNNNGEMYDRDSSGTQYSEGSYTLPALKPFRPQPVRHTPSPALGSNSSTGSIPGYVPGQPRPVGARTLSPASSVGAASPKSAVTTSPKSGMSSQLSGWPQQPQHPVSLPSSATMAAMPTQPNQNAGSHSLARSLSAQAAQSGSNSRSNTPTQPPVRVEHAPPPGVLTARHQATHSASDIGTWRSTSSVGGQSHKSTRSINSSKHSVVSSRHSPSNSLRSPIARVTGLDERGYGHSHSASASVPITPVTATSTHKSRSTLSPTTSARLNHRPSTGSLSSTCSTSLDTEDSSPWDALLRHESPDNVTPITPNDDQDRADLDLLKSSSGLGKEELAMIQERLVEKAKHERNKLRTQREESESFELARQTSATAHVDHHAEREWYPKNGVEQLSPSKGEEPLITSAPARLDGSDSDEYPQFPTHTVPRSELPKGPPPTRPPPPGTAIPPQVAMAVSPGLNSASSAPEPNSNAESPQRKWIDEDPDARRDIEERISQATSNLFRAPSRSASKRSLSKKKIGAPVLVSSSSKVPTTPITTVETHGDKNDKKGPGSRKLSVRLKKGLFRKHGSMEGVPPPPPLPAAVAAARGAPSAARAVTPIAAAFTSSTSTTPKAAQTPVVPTVSQPQSPDIASPASPSATSPSESKVYPRSKSGNGGRTQSPFRAPPVALRQAPRAAGPTSPISQASDMDELERTMSHKSAQNAFQTINDSNPPDEGDHITQIPRSADATIQRFYEAGRAIGLDDHRLSELLESSASTPRTPSVPEFDTSPLVSPTTGLRGRIPSPVAEDVVTFGEPVDRSIVRRTLVMPNDSPPTSPRRSEHRARSSRHALPPLQTSSQHISPPTSPTSPMKRGNSIRRKPIQYTGEDLDLVERSPKMSSHRRTESNQSAFSLPPAQPIKGIPAQSDAYDSAPQSAASRSSMGMPHSSTNGSFLDYYAHNNNRASQGLEITEYADGRVVWNIVNALRSNDGHARHEDQYSHSSFADDGSRASMASIASQSSDYNSSRRGSERMEDHTQPWHVGPTQGLSFIRRPETRVFYTNSMDVADLIDQLSMDHAGATRGRIDIRPTATGQMEFSTLSDLGQPQEYANYSQAYGGHVASNSDDYSAGQPEAHAYSPAYSQGYSAGPTPTESQPHAQHPGQHGYMPTPAHLHPATRGSHAPSAASDAQSPSSASFLSDGSGDRTVEDRLQSLMDRLRAAPGGIAGTGGVPTARQSRQ